MDLSCLRKRGNNLGRKERGVLFFSLALYLCIFIQSIWQEIISHLYELNSNFSRFKFFTMLENLTQSVTRNTKRSFLLLALLNLLDKALEANFIDIPYL